MTIRKPHLDYHIGFRVNQEAFQQIQVRAERAKKPANAWCREKVIEAAAIPRITFAEYAILAEVIASQEITIQLLYAIVTEGKPSQERFRQITTRAHATKQDEARKLLQAIMPNLEANNPMQQVQYMEQQSKG